MIINKLDNVEVNLENGHKYAIFDIKKGENVIKYGNPIGHATEDIKKGEHIHTHNMKTNLSATREELAKVCGFSLANVKRALKELTDNGYISAKHPTNQENGL